jgi:hypothetical protein
MAGHKVLFRLGQDESGIGTTWLPVSRPEISR